MPFSHYCIYMFAFLLLIIWGDLNNDNLLCNIYVIVELVKKKKKEIMWVSHPGLIVNEQ